MRRWMAAPLMFAFAAALTISGETPQAIAGGKAAPIEETFMTADGVQLRGLFHPSDSNPGTAPVVILLYPPGKDVRDKEQDMTKGDWVGLANRLNKEGFNVFRFDWRGHGKNGSDIKDTDRFWNPGLNPYSARWNNSYVSGGPPKKPVKSDLYFKDIKDPVKYAPAYLLDLAAVRAHLDTKNDAGELNTSSIYLIGSENAATLGMAWIATEWNRPAYVPKPNQLGRYPRYEFVPQPLLGGIESEAGADISGAVWLSANHPSSMSESQIKSWISRHAPKLRDNNHMLFLYAEKDKKSQKTSDFFFNEVLVGKGDKKLGLNPLPPAYLKELKGADQLTGVALLGNNASLKTEDTIMKFLSELQKDRAKLVRKNRGFTAPWFIGLSAFGFN
jgi:hypothetical protein